MMVAVGMIIIYEAKTVGLVLFIFNSALDGSLHSVESVLRN